MLVAKNAICFCEYGYQVFGTCMYAYLRSGRPIRGTGHVKVCAARQLFLVIEQAKTAGPSTIILTE